MQLFYGSIWADFRWLVREALKSQCNVGFIHQVRKEYKADDWTGDYELDGWRGIVFETQVHLRHRRVEGPVFETSIEECTQNANLMGSVLSSKDEDNTFPNLAANIFGESVKDWQ